MRTPKNKLKLIQLYAKKMYDNDEESKEILPTTDCHFFYNDFKSYWKAQNNKDVGIIYS